MIFSIASSLFFFVLIMMFFKGHKICHKFGLHCIIKTVPCCPCPDPCLLIKPYHTMTNASTLDNRDATEIPNGSLGDNAVRRSEIYFYYGGQKTFLHGKPLPLPSEPAANGEDMTKVRDVIICFYCYIHILQSETTFLD